MSETHKARKVDIRMGVIPLDVYQMPNGNYKLYPASIMGAIDEVSNGPSLRRFLSGKSPEALPHKDFKLQQVPQIEVVGFSAPIKPVPIEIAIAYWKYKYRKGNQKAGALIDACLHESIERRADAAFGVVRSEEEREQRFASHMTDEAIAEATTHRQENPFG